MQNEGTQEHRHGLPFIQEETQIPFRAGVRQQRQEDVPGLFGLPVASCMRVGTWHA